MARLLIYWVLFGYFAVGAFFNGERPGIRQPTAPWLFRAGGVLVAGLIGLRYQVGADWVAYVRMFFHAAYADLFSLLALGDPGYQVLNWVVQRLGMGFWLVNLLCGAAFAFGLFRFARIQPNPWLAVLVSVPYLIIVVAMGYSRQGVAIGILLAGLASLSQSGSLLRFAAYVLAATLFHKTALIALPLAAIGSTRNNALNLVIATGLTYLLYSSFLATSVDRLVGEYVRTGYSSEGTLVRVAMSVIPAIFFLLNWRAFHFKEGEWRVWRNFSVAAIGFAFLLIIFPSSTAIDRMALYLSPLQIAVLSRAPGIGSSHRFGTSAVILYSLLVQFVWFNFAEHADDWIPYRIYPIGHEINLPHLR